MRAVGAGPTETTGNTRDVGRGFIADSESGISRFSPGMKWKYDIPLLPKRVHPGAITANNDALRGAGTFARLGAVCRGGHTQVSYLP